MRTLTILLPDTISQLLHAEAKRQNLDAATVCSALVAEHFLERTRKGPTPPVQEDRVSKNAQSPWSEGANMLDVKISFPNYPDLSIQLAQQFVDEALKMPGVSAHPTARGVGIKPNFAWIEYLHKLYPGGIGLSFYGSRTSLQNLSLERGRTSSYSRARAHTQEELKPLLDVMRRSYRLKMGRNP